MRNERHKNVYLSGGFGNFISIDSALNIGLLPKELSGRITPWEMQLGQEQFMHCCQR